MNPFVVTEKERWRGDPIFTLRISMVSRSCSLGTVRADDCGVHAWCSEIGSLISLDAPVYVFHASSDVREPGKAVCNKFDVNETST